MGELTKKMNMAYLLLSSSFQFTDEVCEISMRDITKNSNRDSTSMRTVTTVQLCNCKSNMAS